MKKVQAKPGKKGAILLLWAASLMALSCEEYEESGTAIPVSGTWKMMDYIQVNNEDGRPRQSKHVQSMAAFVELLDQGIYVGENKEDGARVSGTWSSNSDNLLFTFNDGTSIAVKVDELTNEKLSLIQSYPAEEGFASGTIYYSFIRN
jgi:hypothetical protein